MIKLKPSEKYIFSLLDINLIDFDNIDFDTNDDTISLPLITTNVPIITDNLDDDMCLFINDAIIDGDMWFTYNAIDHKVEELVIEIHCIQHQIFCNAIICLMEQTQHPEYDKYKQIYDKFIADIKDKFKEQIRAMMTDARGEFVKDKFIKSAYIQARIDKQKNIFYTIHRWWEKLIEGDIENDISKVL